MPLNVQQANMHLQRLLQQRSEVTHAVRMLLSYKQELSRFWSGKEMLYFERSINGLIQRYQSLERKLDSVGGSISLAIDEILEEEALAAAAAAAAQIDTVEENV